MQPDTKLLAIRGNKKGNDCPELHPGFLSTVSSKCKKLEEFILEDYDISRDKVMLIINLKLTANFVY